MRTPPRCSATASPTIADIRRVWRADRSVHDQSAGVYLQWIGRFRGYCAQRGFAEGAELTHDGARRFVVWYARHRHLDQRSLSGAHSALYAFSRVYQVMALSLAAWRAPRCARPPTTALLRAYADHLARHRGNLARTIHKKLDHVGKLQTYLAGHGKTWRSMTLVDIDAFLIGCADRFARTTVSDIACTVRCFAGFLLSTGRISVDFAAAVIAPVQPRHERPRRALPWDDVLRLLRAVDISTAPGLRDYALLLMMSTYGFGAGEVTGLQLQDIDWDNGTLKVMRPKTGVAFTLPLLPAVAKALSRYLRHGRPPSTPTRHVFVQQKMPFGPLSCSSAVRHILVKHARVAGLDAPFLGSHVLRHSNAARQVDLGTRPRVLSDLLGHRDPESISAYVRIATQSLRDISLPVPT